MLVALLCWLLVGLIVGAAGGKMVNPKDDDPRVGMVVGAIAAALGGLVFRLLSHTDTTGPGLWSLVVAVGVVLVIVVWHISRSASRT